MKKILKVLAIVAIVGLLFFVGIGVNDSEESYGGLVYSVQDVSAEDPCTPPPPPYPNNCDP